MSQHRQRLQNERDPLLQGRSILVDSTIYDYNDAADFNEGASSTCQRQPPANPDIDPDTDNTMPSALDVVQPTRKWIVEPVAFMFCAGMLSQIPVLTQYLYYRVGQQYNETLNSTRAFVCDSSALPNASEHMVTSKIQSEATEWTMYRSLACSVTSLLVMPLFTSSSDYLGRKPALLFPCLGMLVDTIGLLLVLLLDLPIIWIVISGGIGALGGGFGTQFASIFAYLADTTTRKERPVRVAIVEGTFGLSAGIIEFAIGWWIRLMGYTAPMIFSASITLANLLYIVFLVPEVRLKRQKLSGNTLLKTALAPLTNIAQLFGTSARLAVNLGLLMAAMGIYSASFMGSTIVSSLYQMNYPFCLDSVFIGYLNAAKIVCFQIGVALGLLILRRCFGIRPLGLSIVGLVSAILGSLATGIASSTITLFIASAVALFSMLPIPMLRAYTSQISPADRQGALFSCIGILEVCGNLAGTVVFNMVYKNTQDWMPGLVYLAVACTSMVALLLTCACAIVNCCCWPSISKPVQQTDVRNCDGDRRTSSYGT